MNYPMKKSDEKKKNLDCSIATLTINDKIFFCNNEDFMRAKDQTFILFVPSQVIPKKWNEPEEEGNDKIFGFTLVGSRFDDKLFPQGGINSEGLSYDINALPPTVLKKREGKAWSTAFNFCDILWTNRTVDEVITWFKTHKFPFEKISYQIHFADALGDAVVIGANEEGELVYTRKGDKKYLISTNFNLVNHDNCEEYPCKRFDDATEIAKRLVKKDDVTLDDCVEILKKIHFEYKKEKGTLYSNIFDLVKRKIYLYHLGNFTQKVEFNFPDEIVSSKFVNEADQYKIAGFTKNGRLDFEGIQIYTICKLFDAKN